MMRSRLKRTAVSLIAIGFACSSAQAATTITIGVSPSLGNVVSDLVGAFQNLYPTSGYSVSVVVDSDANIESAIVAGGATGPYDIFLSQSALRPLQLQLQYPSLVTGSFFPFAKDSLVLYSSAAAGVNVSGGLPATPQAFATPDPTLLDAYGIAAAQVLLRYPAYIRAAKTGIVTLTSDPVASYVQTEYLGVGLAFTGLSQICQSSGGAQTFELGSSDFVYKFGQDYFNPIVATGININRTRTVDQSTEATNFINLLTGMGTSVGTNLLQQYCYTLPN